MLFYIGKMILSILPVAPFVILWRVLAVRRLKRQGAATRPWHEFCAAFLVLYTAGLLSLTVDFVMVLSSGFQANGSQSMTPFHTIRTMFARGSDQQILINIWGNIGMFIPVTFLWCLGWKRRLPFLSSLFLGAGLSVFIEYFQQFCGRSTDVDDLILNTLGGVLGWLLFCLFRPFPKFLSAFRAKPRKTRVAFVQHK